MEDYSINLSEYKNNHIRNNKSLEEFNDTQKIGLFKVKCSKCKDEIRDKMFIIDFYICNTYDIQLCKKCKEIHDNNHNIIFYNDKNYICKKHNKNFIQYCKECKENLCKL